MNKTTEALKLAEEALDELRYANDTDIAKTKYYKALAAIREALAEQEPVAWMYALAAKAGFDAELMQINHERGMPSNAEVFGNLVRDFVRAEALEEAAKVCEQIDANNRGFPLNAKTYAAAIRARGEK